MHLDSILSSSGPVKSWSLHGSERKGKVALERTWQPLHRAVFPFPSYTPQSSHAPQEKELQSRGTSQPLFPFSTRGNDWGVCEGKGKVIAKLSSESPSSFSHTALRSYSHAKGVPLEHQRQLEMGRNVHFCSPNITFQYQKFMFHVQDRC